jgi:hypothetical protein
MESEDNNINNNCSKDKIKNIQAQKIYLDDSETNDNSTKYKTDNSDKNNSLIEEINKDLKQSLGFISKKNYIEKPEYEEKIINQRKYTIEECLIIKDFVPQLKPIEMHLVPSKLCLNKRVFGDLKNYKCFISCPNSEEESDGYLSLNKTSDNNPTIKKTRHLFKEIKCKNIPKVMTKEIIESNSKLFQEDLNVDYDSDKGSLDLNNNCILYDDNDFINYNMTYIDIENENKKTNEEHENKSNKNNSCSILDVLKNRLSFDDTF